jgi:hypothetical protein
MTLSANGSPLATPKLNSACAASPPQALSKDPADKAAETLAILTTNSRREVFEITWAPVKKTKTQFAFFK